MVVLSERVVLIDRERSIQKHLNELKVVLGWMFPASLEL